MPDVDILVDRLVTAAERAIRAQRDSLTFDTGRVRSVTLELEVSAGASVQAAHAYVGRSVAGIREPK